MRNFWLVGNVDGRRTALTGGPRSREGGLDLHLYQMINGESVKAIEVYGYPIGNGRLRVEVWAGGECVYEKEDKR